MNALASAPSRLPYDWGELGQYLASPQSLLVDDTFRAELLGEWREIVQLEENLDDAILVALVGGTGVGKSTLINALAGHAISRSGDRRPTTNRVVLYIHRDTELPPETPPEDFAQPFVLHANPKLQKVIVLDFPDFDSAESTHAHVIRRYLPYLDVLLVVVDDVKYADQRLYELLQSLQQDPTNVYVILNKTDRLRVRYGEATPRVVDDILRDLQDKLTRFAKLDVTRDHLFAIAAKPVQEAREANPKVNVDSTFLALEECIEGYQEAKHRRLAKERNLLARKQHLADLLAQDVLSPTNLATLQSLRDLVENAIVELSRTRDTIPQAILSEPERRATRSGWMRMAAPRWGLPVSLFFTLLSELPWLRSSPIAEQHDLAARIERHYLGYLEAARNLARRFNAELVGISWNSNVHAATETNANEKGLWLPVAAAILQRAATPNISSRGLLTWIQAHGLPLLVLLSAIGLRFAHVVGPNQGTLSRFSALIGFFSPMWLLNTALAVVLAYVATAVVLWLREIQRLDSALMLGEKQVREQVEIIGSEQLRQIQQRLDSLEREMHWVRQIVPPKS